MIREVEEKDFQLLTNLYKEIFATNISFNEEFNNKKVYVENNKIIGFIDYSIIYDRAEINYIWVNPDYQRKGIATKLLNNMLSNLNGVLNVTLEVNDSNTKAINFYLKNGFKTVSKREKYYRDGHDAYLMMKVI